MRRIDSAGDQKRAEAFLQVFDKARNRYEARLSDEQALDFHDLINQAIKHLREETTGHDYSHVLVDEFQDIPSGRMELLKALRKADVAYFLAGRLTRSARRLTLHLPRRWPWEAQFSRALARLRSLPLPA